MSDQPPDSWDGDDRRGQPQGRRGRRDEPRGLSRGGERHERSPMNMEEGSRENHGWSWSHGLHIIYHPRGCSTCMEYGQHIMEAEFVRDDEYVAAQCQRQEDTEYWRIKANKIQEDLGEADDYIRSLEARIRELEKDAARHREYDDNRKGKRARYDSPYEGGSGLNSLAMPQGALPPPPPPQQQPTNQGMSSYAQVVQELAPEHDQEDVHMEDGEVGRFPPLPTPQRPLEPARGSMIIPRSANWTLATRGRLTMPRRGGFGFAPPRLPPLVITSVEELDHHLDAAGIPGNELALTCMCAYVRDAQNVLREARSPVQNAALLKWKIPGWVPAEARPPVKGGNKDAPVGVNTPRLTDSPEEWAWCVMGGTADTYLAKPQDC
jgi:hypothetical protein